MVGMTGRKIQRFEFSERDIPDPKGAALTTVSPESCIHFSQSQIPDAPWCWYIYQHLPEQNHPVLQVKIYQHHGAYIPPIIYPSYTHHIPIMNGKQSIPRHQLMLFSSNTKNMPPRPFCEESQSPSKAPCMFMSPEGGRMNLHE